MSTVNEQLGAIVLTLGEMRAEISANGVAHAEIIGEMRLQQQNISHLGEKIDEVSVTINGNGADPMPLRLSLAEKNIKDLTEDQTELKQNQKENQKDERKNKTQYIISILGFFGMVCAAAVTGYFAYIAA